MRGVEVLAALSPLLRLASAQDAEPKNPLAGHGSFLLLASVAFAFLMFYMVNSVNKDVKSNAWSVMNTGASIFCAVMLNDIVNTCINHLLGVNAEGKATYYHVFSNFLQLVGWWYFIVVVLFLARGSLLHTKAFGTVGGHILGFAALGTFGKLAETPAFNTSPVMTLLDVVICLATIFLLFLTSKLRVEAAFSRCGCEITAEEHDRWHDQCQDTGTDFFALSTGFLLSMAIRFVISGSLPTVDGQIGNSSTPDSWIIELSLVGVFFLFVTSMLSYRRGMMTDGTGAFWLMDFSVSMTADCAAFCIMYAGLWLFGKMVGPDEVMTHVVNAFACSLCAFYFVWGASVFHPGNAWYTGMFAAYGLLVGFSWEKSFDAAADGIGDLPLFSGHSGDWLKVWFKFTLLLIVFPAWMVYILPKADDELKAAMSIMLGRGSLPLRAVCDDHNLYDGALSSDDESDTEATRALKPTPAQMAQMQQAIAEAQANERSCSGKLERNCGRGCV